MNGRHGQLLGTFSLPICWGELLNGLGECLESTELGMTFEVVSRRSASREDHRIVLVPHSDICKKSDVKIPIPSQGGYALHIQYVLGFLGRRKGR